jgi:hypothetical protein
MFVNASIDRRSPALCLSSIHHLALVIFTRPFSQNETKDNIETVKKSGNEDLSLLVKFMDTDLAPILETRRNIGAGTLESIAFPDLYHLFHHGQLVRRSADMHLRIYRVVRFQGGREVSQPKAIVDRKIDRCHR